MQDACEGTFILGASGSGKTTGSGRALAEAFLASDFGGLILTVKPGEAKLWEAYARAAGREEQLCIVRPGGHFKLNFLDYESRRPGKGSGLIENLVALFYTIIDVSAKGQHNRELSRFWSDVGKELIRNTFRVLTLATSPLKLDEVCRFIIESPQRAYGGNPKPAGPWFTQCMDRAMAVAQGTPQEAVMAKAQLHWLDTFYNLAPDTRSCVITAFSSMADVFVEPAINDLFCTQTTIIPENVLDGAIIVVDLPLLSGYEAVGLFAQSIWKYLFQKAIERRDDPDDECRRPAFLWIDEAQHFHSANDALFQATARSARCATVYLTQNISGFYGNSTAHSRESVDGFLGNLNTKILHCNNDHASNVWAANQIGQYKTQRLSTSISEQPAPRGDGWFSNMLRPRDKSVSSSMQEDIQYAVQPSAFLNMRTGGKRFDFLVDAYFVKGGAQFSTGRHYFPTVFRQEFP